MGHTLPILSQPSAQASAQLHLPSSPLPPELTTGSLIDSHGRIIRDLRLSITDRCNFRCPYCLDKEVRFLPDGQRLSIDELVRLASITVSLGVRKIRITGGEPTLHPELDELISQLAQLDIDDLAMTTNGSRLDAARLTHLHTLGLRRLTFSIDSIDPQRYAQMTHSTTDVSRIIESIQLATQAGFDPVRINTVVIRGMNEDDIVPLAALARDLGVEVRFIEFMPLDAGHQWSRDRVVSGDAIIDAINVAYPLEPIGRDSVNSTSLRYRFADGTPGGIGTISPVTRAFCGACSRLRITADGKVRPCLFSHHEWDVRAALRDGADDGQIIDILRHATWAKQKGHGIGADTFVPPTRSMSAIGG